MKKERKISRSERLGFHGNISPFGSGSCAVGWDWDGSSSELGMYVSGMTGRSVIMTCEKRVQEKKEEKMNK
jgi:hypothetical protein